VGYDNFRLFAPKIGYHSNVHWAITKERPDWSCPPIPIVKIWWRSAQHILRA